jgi:hypothetical protein
MPSPASTAIFLVEVTEGSLSSEWEVCPFLASESLVGENLTTEAQRALRNAIVEDS